MTESYSREQRAALEAALRGKKELRCPVCGSAMNRQVVPTPPGVPYVRHRVWLLCTGCRRSVSLDDSR